MPAIVPNGPSDTASFDVSNTTTLTLSAATEVNGITFNAGASAYTIGAYPGYVLTISGVGVTNNSGIQQNFVTFDGHGRRGSVMFTNSATAGNGNTYSNNGSSFGEDTAATEFHDTSSAGTSTFINNAPTESFAGAGLTDSSINLPPAPLP